MTTAGFTREMPSDHPLGRFCHVNDLVLKHVCLMMDTNLTSTIQREQTGLIFSCTFWPDKTVVVFLAAITTETMLLLAFPVRENT